MWVLNKKSKMVQEFSNKDVLRLLQKDSNYVVAETREACFEETPVKSSEKPVETVSKEDNKVLAEEAEQATDFTREELTGMTVKQLRTVAKDKGIQSYSNMDKNTLVEVILAY